MISRRGDILFFFLGVIFLLFPGVVSAGMTIHEVMYDVPGTDTGKEWIEIYNDGASVDLAGWKLFEGNTNHGIATTTAEQNFIVATGEYAVIVDNVEKFLADWPSFSGVLFDSSFSLGNTGETLELRDADLIAVDGVMYSDAAGAKGNGLSLHRSGSDFVAASPTPGMGGSPGQSVANEDSGAGEPVPAPSVPAGGGGSVSFPVEPQIFADAGKDRTVIVGADSVFEGKAWGLKKEPLTEARFLWNFGNGLVKEGRKVLMHYEYPGSYVASLSVGSGEYSAANYITVTAIAADIVISDADASHIELWNKTNRDLDLSFWRLAANGAQFMLPEHTFILAGKKLIFAKSVTGLSPADISQAALLYPNGAPVLSAVSPSAKNAVALPQAPKPAATAIKSPNPVSKVSPQVQQVQEAPPLAVPLAGVSVAAVAGAKAHSADTRGLAPYLVGLAVIIATGVAAVLFWRGREKDDIKILE